MSIQVRYPSKTKIHKVLMRGKGRTQIGSAHD